ncbi:hypothetical protein LguiB_018500 [Lonicera macranthoides]
MLCLWSKSPRRAQSITHAVLCLRLPSTVRHSLGGTICVELHKTDEHGRVGYICVEVYTDFTSRWNKHHETIALADPLIAHVTYESPYFVWYRRITRRYIVPPSVVVPHVGALPVASLLHIVGDSLAKINALARQLVEDPHHSHPASVQILTLSETTLQSIQQDHQLRIDPLEVQPPPPTAIPRPPARGVVRKLDTPKAPLPTTSSAPTTTSPPISTIAPIPTTSPPLTTSIAPLSTTATSLSTSTTPIPTTSPARTTTSHLSPSRHHLVSPHHHSPPVFHHIALHAYSDWFIAATPLSTFSSSPTTEVLTQLPSIEDVDATTVAIGRGVGRGRGRGRGKVAGAGGIEGEGYGVVDAHVGADHEGNGKPKRTRKHPTCGT